MAAAIIDGKHIAETIRQELAEAITQLQTEHHLTPGLAVVLVGDNPASKVYVRNKNKACHDIGIYSNNTTYRKKSEKELLQLIDTLNREDKIHGIWCNCLCRIILTSIK